jgi:CheY-like chemotaxis protein
MTTDHVIQVEPVAANRVVPKTVLIVDDDEAQVAALEHRLDQLGFRVLTALRGSDALQLAFRDPPDLVLLDLRLPDMEGFDVCSQLADSPCTCGVPVIIVSALEGHDIVRRARSVGCEFYLRKPYDPNVLLTLIEQAFLESSQLGAGTGSGF